MATIITGNGVHMGNVGQGQKLLGELRSGPYPRRKKAKWKMSVLIWLGDGLSSLSRCIAKWGTPAYLVGSTKWPRMKWEE